MFQANCMKMLFFSEFIVYAYGFKEQLFLTKLNQPMQLIVSFPKCVSGTLDFVATQSTNAYYLRLK